MRLGSLFSGIGGFELGAKKCGIKTLWNCEIDSFNRRILKESFPDTIQYEDINKMQHPAYVDIISGGFPCQDISRAKYKRKGIKGERSRLWSEFYRIIKEVKPKYVIIENSIELRKQGLEFVLRDLAESGYNAEWKNFYAASFGLPTLRERIILVAYSTKVRYAGSGIEYQTIFNSEACSKQEATAPPLHIKAIGHSYLSIPEHLRLDTGIPQGLDKREIGAYGNAISPLLAEYIFNSILKYESFPGSSL
jgi:DNA (cytosine-5)-methyltransferase 1